MRQVIYAVAVLVGMLAGLPPAQGQDSSAERAAAADKYLLAVPMEKMFEDTVAELAKQVPDDQREAFVGFMKAALRVDVLRQITRETLIDVFSAEELNALAEFYGSAHGQSAMRKFGVYVGRVMPAVQQEVRFALEAARERMR